MGETTETQYEAAQRMYSNRAADYDDSWHPNYTDRFMALVDVKPGHRVLDLACGTGLDAAIAAARVGDDGIVIGVDASEPMLNLAKRKQAADPTLASRLQLVQHSATSLGDCPGVEKESFDFIICSNAFVLFSDPAGVIAHWREYLKPGGRVAIDVTHEHNLRSGSLMEKVAARMGVAYPADRSWIKSKDSFSDILRQQGLEVERVEALEKEVGKGTVFLDVSAADDQFDYITSFGLTSNIATEGFKAKAKPLFREEWAAAAVDGKVKICDILYVYVARKL